MSMTVRTPEQQVADDVLIGQGVYGLGQGALSRVLPPVAVGQPTSDWHNWIPGAATWLYNRIPATVEMLVNSAADSIPATEYGTSLPYNDAVSQTPPAKFVFPGHEASQALQDNNTATVLKALPDFVPPTMSDQQQARDIGTEAGKGLTEVAPPGLGLINKGLEHGAAALGALPGQFVPATINATLAGVQEGLKQPAQDDKDAITIVPPEQINQPGSVASVAPIVPGTAEPPLTPDNDTGIPYWEYGAIGAAGLGLLWGIAKHSPGAVNTTADWIRGQTSNIAEANAELARNMPRGRGAPAFEMPLPNNAGGMTRQWATDISNPNAVLNEVAKAQASSPAEAQSIIAANEMINNPANANRRMEGLFRTGIEEGTGHTFPKMVDFKEATEKLDPGQIGMADAAAWYKNELNLRNQIIKQNANKGIAWTDATDPDIRVSFTDRSTDELRQIVAQAEAIPAVKVWLEQKKAITDALVDSAEKRGMISSAQADYARTWYPDFMPTIGPEGEYLHSWEGKIREPASGYNDFPVPADQAIIKHFQATIQSMQRNDWQRFHLFRQQAIQDADPSAARIISKPPTGQPAPSGMSNLQPAPREPPSSAVRRSITVQTSNGPVTWDVNSTPYYRNLTANPQALTQTAWFTNATRKLYQNLTTGPAGMMLGHPFNTTIAMKDIPLIAANAPKGMWRGELDRAFNTRLPFDPTQVIGTGTTIIKDAGTVIARHYADLLGSTSNPMSQQMRALLGNEKMDAFVSWMRQHIEQSNLATREAAGVGGGGNRSMVDFRASMPDEAGVFRDPTAGRVAPSLTQSPTLDRLPMPVQGNVRAFLNLNNLIKDLFGVVADAPHSYIYDLNRDNAAFSPRALASEVQQLTGNPGTMGAGKWTQRLGRSVPFYNTSIQGASSVMRALRDRPGSMAMTVIPVLLTLAAAEHLTALLSGPQHVEDLENRVSNDTRTRNAIIYHGHGTDINQKTEIPLVNEWQPLYQYISGLVGHGIGTWNALSDQPTYERVVHTLAGMFEHHVEHDVAQRSVTGGVNAMVAPDATPPLSAGVALLTGQEVKNIPEQLATNWFNNLPLTSGLTSGGGQDNKGPPGQGGYDSLLTRANSGVWNALSSAIGAGANAAYDMGSGFVHRMNVDKEHEWAWRGLKEDYTQQWKDNTKFMNSVWQNNLAQSSFGSLEERNHTMWSHVMAAAGANADIRGEGFSKQSRGVPLVMTQDTNIPTDPQMRGLYLTMADGAKAINRDVMPKISQIRAQLDNVRSSPFMPEEKRRIQNGLSEQLYQQNIIQHSRLLDLNARMSAQIGRHVDLADRIDWQGTVDQFKQ